MDSSPWKLGLQDIYINIFVMIYYPLFFSVQFSHLVISNWLRSHGLQHTRLPCPSPTPEAYSNSCPSYQWCHPTISSSVVPFACLQSFPISESFPMSQFFTSDGQSIGVLASEWVLPMNIQDWFPLGWTGMISLQSKGLSSVSSSTTVRKHQFFHVNSPLSGPPSWTQMSLIHSPILCLLIESG